MAGARPLLLVLGNFKHGSHTGIDHCNLKAPSRVSGRENRSPRADRPMSLDNIDCRSAGGVAPPRLQTGIVAVARVGPGSSKTPAPAPCTAPVFLVLPIFRSMLL